MRFGASSGECENRMVTVQFGRAVRQQVPYRLKQLFEKVPKTELHLHLGGSTRRRDIKAFMLENGVPPEQIPQLFKRIKPLLQKSYRDFRRLLSNSEHVFNPSQFRRATVGIMKEAAKDNVKILENQDEYPQKRRHPSRNCGSC